MERDVEGPLGTHRHHLTSADAPALSKRPPLPLRYTQAPPCDCHYYAGRRPLPFWGGLLPRLASVRATHVAPTPEWVFPADEPLLRYGVKEKNGTEMPSLCTPSAPYTGFYCFFDELALTGPPRCVSGRPAEWCVDSELAGRSSAKISSFFCCCTPPLSRGTSASFSGCPPSKHARAQLIRSHDV